MKTLVIGGGGFVGLNIVERLLSDGRAVTLFDLAPPPDAALKMLGALPGDLTIIPGDVRSPDDLARAFDPEPDAVVYGAAVTAGTERDRDAPEVTIGVNLEGFLEALRLSRRFGVRRVINLSSGAACGDAAFRGIGPVREDDPPDPKSIYAITKFASERVGDRMADLWGLDVIGVRLSAVFGRWERRTSMRDTPSPQFQILEALASGRPALVERLDSRDWIYAPDVARAVAALLDAGALRHQLYNISTGTTWSVLDWGRAMATHFPGGECRLAGPGEVANIALHADTDRRPLSVERLAKDVDFPRCCNIDQSAENYRQWHLAVGADYK